MLQLQIKKPVFDAVSAVPVIKKMNADGTAGITWPKNRQVFGSE
jgi:hypothetical protein